MKHVIILPDGAADEPLAEYNGQTPLEAANLPNMDWVAAHGQIGRSLTVPDGFIPGTDVATLSVFGYDPARYYTGRAPLEAAAQGLKAKPGEIVFRCNFITVDENGHMADFTADHISQPDADQLINDLNQLLSDEFGCVFHAGVSYRNLMMINGADGFEGLRCQAPHDIPGLPVSEYPPKGPGEERIIEIMKRASAMLADHPVNQQRIENGKKPATNIWLWGQGQPAVLEPFVERFGVQGVVITGVDIIRGIAVCMGMTLIEVEGATGYLDTDYAAKGRAGVDAIAENNLVVVHIEAPDEAGHEGDAKAKIESLERVDELIVGPLLRTLQAKYSEEGWRLLIAPDHPTPVSTKAHSSEPPPYCYCGTDVHSIDEATTFGETEARTHGELIDPGSGLMGVFFG